jgi:hypothetical protein
VTLGCASVLVNESVRGAWKRRYAGPITADAANHRPACLLGDQSPVELFLQLRHLGVVLESVNETTLRSAS